MKLTYKLPQKIFVPQELVPNNCLIQTKEGKIGKKTARTQGGIVKYTVEYLEEGGYDWIEGQEVYPLPRGTIVTLEVE